MSTRAVHSRASYRDRNAGSAGSARRAQAPTFGEIFRGRVAAMLRTCFNCLALNLALVLSSVLVITLPAALNAAAVALDRWRVDGEDRAVREFLQTLRASPVARTTLAIGGPLAMIAIALEEVHFFARGGTPVNWVCLGFGAAALLIGIGTTGYVVVLCGRRPSLAVTDLWSLCLRLALHNMLLTGPLFVVEFTGAALLGLLDPALALIGLPLAFLSSVRLTADIGTRRAGYGPGARKRDGREAQDSLRILGMAPPPVGTLATARRPSAGDI
jgi:hypothetical protein